MGIRKEIDRLRSVEEAMSIGGNKEEQRLMLLQECYDGEDFLRDRARTLCGPFVQKLEDSGVVKILADLREAEDLYLIINDRRIPARPEVTFRVRMNVGQDHFDFSFSGTDLVSLLSGDHHYVLFGGPNGERQRRHGEDSIEDLRKYLEILLSGDQGKDATVEGLASLQWNHWHNEGIRANSSGHSVIASSLFRGENGVYVLRLTNGDLFSEPWSRSRLERAVAREYVHPGQLNRVMRVNDNY